MKKLYQILMRINPYLLFGTITFILGYVFISREFMTLPLILICIGILSFAIGFGYDDLEEDGAEDE